MAVHYKGASFRGSAHLSATVRGNAVNPIRARASTILGASHPSQICNLLIDAPSSIFESVS